MSWLLSVTSIDEPTEFNIPKSHEDAANDKEAKLRILPQISLTEYDENDSLIEGSSNTKGPPNQQVHTKTRNRVLQKQVALQVDENDNVFEDPSLSGSEDTTRSTDHLTNKVDMNLTNKSDMVKVNDPQNEELESDKTVISETYQDSTVEENQSNDIGEKDIPFLIKDIPTERKPSGRRRSSLLSKRLVRVMSRKKKSKKEHNYTKIPPYSTYISIDDLLEYGLITPEDISKPRPIYVTKHFKEIIAEDNSSAVDFVLEPIGSRGLYMTRLVDKAARRERELHREESIA